MSRFVLSNSMSSSTCPAGKNSTQASSLMNLDFYKEEQMKNWAEEEPQRKYNKKVRLNSFISICCKNTDKTHVHHYQILKQTDPEKSAVFPLITKTRI